MTRSEILQISKPIFFNTEMVRAIMDGRKTVTRRVVKPQPEGINDIIYTSNGSWYISPDDCEQGETPVKPPYNPGDYLYVRETWSPMYPDKKSDDVVGYMYRADEGMSVSEYDRRYPNGKDYQWPGIWKPSIHMPKEAIRIFLRVTGVRVERLSDMDYMDAIYEGIEPQLGKDGYPEYNPMIDFIDLWDSTIPPKERDKYGWDANPWVWVIEFERVEVTV